MKSKLKELAALCIDKGVTFNCNSIGGTFVYRAYHVVNGDINYFGNVSEFAADYDDGSIERLNEVIALVEKYNG